MNPILRADHLSKRFAKVQAVKDISFDVQEGEVFGILGPNGAGKSTTLAMISGLVHADQGAVWLNGIALHKNPREARRHLGVLNEVPGFYGHLTAVENLRVFSRLKGSTSSDIDSAMEKVGLSEYRTKPVRTFSQGMRKRLGLANSMLGHPKLIVLDEPTNGLDPKGSARILDLIRSLASEDRVSIVISSNLLFDIEAVCGRVLLIEKGQALFCKSVHELLKPSEEVFLLKIDPLDGALAFLRGFDGVRSVRSVGQDALAITLSGGTAAGINKRLVHAGFDVSELSRMKRTLQDLFLELRE